MRQNLAMPICLPSRLQRLQRAACLVLLAWACSGPTMVLAQVAPRPPAQPPEFTFNGAGTVPCSQALGFLANPESRLQFEQWLYGYLTSYNQYIYSWHRVALPDAPSMMTFVENYCRRNPQERIWCAAGALVRELGGSPAAYRELA